MKQRELIDFIRFVEIAASLIRVPCRAGCDFPNARVYANLLQIL
jgi:hypothetical protein